jgi:hypothetical protein
MLGPIVPGWVVQFAQDVSNPGQMQFYRSAFALVVSLWVLALGVMLRYGLIFADYRVAIAGRRRDGTLSPLAVALGRSGQGALWLCMALTASFPLSALVFELGTYGLLDRETFAPVIEVCRSIYIALDPG